ncbi:hypothetical protein D2U14_11865, partial [Lacticaseibacillus paracasei]
VFLRYPKRAYTFSVDYFSTPESVDPKDLCTDACGVLYKDLFLSASRRVWKSEHRGLEAK